MKLIDNLLVWLVRNARPQPYEIQKMKDNLQLIQAGLKSLKYDPGPIDGIDGPKTGAALMRWRTDQRQAGRRVSDIELIQRGLQWYGFDPGGIDGIDGPKTERAKSAWRASRVRVGGRGMDLHLQCQRWAAAEVSPGRRMAVDGVADRIVRHRARYEGIERATGVPWFVVGCLHNMESGGNFGKHLHEGSPLTGRTIYVPRGRPVLGHPPFTWEESALDAIAYDHLGAANWANLGELLYTMEAYNGTGYLRYHRDVPSPYLWGATTIERAGKYIADGRWSDTATTKQIGCAAVLKTLESRGQIELPKA